MPVDKFGRSPKTNVTNVDGVSMKYVNNNFIRRDGTNTATGSINMSGNTLMNVTDPKHNQDVATKAYVVDKVSNMTRDLEMGGNEITGLSLGQPKTDGHAASKSYVDTMVMATTLNIDKKALLLDGSTLPTQNISWNNKSITDVADPVNQQDVATKNYVDSKTVINAVSGDINMGGHLIRGLPKNYPPVYSGDEAASWSQTVHLVQDSLSNLVDPKRPQEVATKRYVDSRKPMITVWSEEKGPLNTGHEEWSFGNGASRDVHGKIGYIMMTPGRILRMSISTDCKNDDVEVGILVDDRVLHVNDKIVKPIRQASFVKVLEHPVLLSRGSKINFKTLKGSQHVKSAIVSLLIELDL